VRFLHLTSTAGTRWICITTLAVVVLSGSVASAQVEEPIGRYVADARGTWVRLKGDSAVASAIGVNATNLPTRALGLAFGAHVYPIRGRRMAFGIGGEYLTARGSRTQEPTTEGGAQGPTVETTVSSLAPQVSLNFGRRDGWSYISGGIGSASFTAQRLDRAVGEGSRVRAINYGGGARWFTNRRLAVSVDLRFYSIAAQPATSTRPAFPKSRMMVISGGIAVR
jgi:hypothetical protein